MLVRAAPETLAPRHAQRRRSLLPRESLTPDSVDQLFADALNHGVNNDNRKEAPVLQLAAIGESGVTPPSAKSQGGTEKHRGTELRQHSVSPNAFTECAGKCTTYSCCQRGRFCSPMGLVLQSGTLSLIAAFIFVFVLGGSCLVITQSFTTLQSDGPPQSLPWRSWEGGRWLDLSLLCWLDHSKLGSLKATWWLQF